MKRRTALLVICTTLSACTTIPPQQEPASRAGAEATLIAGRIKSALIEQAPTAAAAVDVDVREGVIHLRGFADSPAIRSRLEAAARKAAEGRQLINEIEVR